MWQAGLTLSLLAAMRVAAWPRTRSTRPWYEACAAAVRNHLLAQLTRGSPSCVAPAQVSDRPDPLEDLTVTERESLKEWLGHFEAKYDCVGWLSTARS